MIFTAVSLFEYNILCKACTLCIDRRDVVKHINDRHTVGIDWFPV